MKPIALVPPLLAFLAGCSGAPGYLHTDVLAPEKLGDPVAAGVKIQGDLMTDGSLTYQGSGEVQRTFIDYVEAMRGLGWQPHTADGDPANGMRGTLRKDTRQVEVSITPAGQGGIKVVIQVGPEK